MPLQTRSALDIKLEFCRLASQPSANLSELCRRYHISRPTAYRYLERYKASGPHGLLDRSRRPLASPAKTGQATEAYLIGLKERFPFWGAQKLLAVFDREAAEGLHSLPSCSRSAAERILRQAGLVSGKRQKSALASHERFEYEKPNQLWQMDFKGHVALTQGGRCHPLVILDDHSRFLLCLKAFGQQSMGQVRQALKGCFERFGLPERILCDNGGPWASTHGPSLKASQRGVSTPNGVWVRERTLSGLEAWLISLGIRVIHGAPYHPQTQGKCERLNQTLKHEVLEGRLRSSIQDYQSSFDEWRHCYNQVRPHQALAMKVPSMLYHPSQRPMPQATPVPEYPAGFDLYPVASNGCIKQAGRWVFIGEGLKGCLLGLENAQNEKSARRLFFHSLVVASLNPILPKPSE